jgi:Cu-Zn family superoxide dismutase
MPRTRHALPLAALLLGLPLAAAAQEATPGAMGVADVVLRDAAGAEAGLATLGETPDGNVSIGVVVEGLAPGEHGIHVHETGACDPGGDQPFASAGGHYNPTGASHGAPSGAEGSVPMGTPEGLATPGIEPGHAGDLGNILVDDSGTGRLQITVDAFRFAELADADGSALVVHADPDDLRTDPSGNSGGRLVCGVIFPGQGGATPEATPAS